MQEIIVSANEAGKRLSKLLSTYLNTAPDSFIYKMLRKKNIKLNGGTADGREILKDGDIVKIFLSDETISKFRKNAGYESPAVSDTDRRKDSGDGGNAPSAEAYGGRDRKIKFDVVYKDDNILIAYKPAGVLSQKADNGDYSINEAIIDFLLDNNIITLKSLETFKPSVCNRLDRNTEGLITAGISLMGSRCLSEIIKDRTLHKFYYTIVSGKIGKTIDSSAYITKDRKNNKAVVSRDKTPESEYIHSIFTPVACNRSYTLVKVELITGKSHQIRAQLKHLGYPLIGDRKYGDKRVNRYFADRYGLKNQLLICGEYVFGDIKNELSYMSGKTIKADFPDHYNRICKDLF